VSLRKVGAFTLLELVITMALAGAIAAFAVVPAASAHGRVSASTAAGRFALVLREAQARAQTTGSHVRVTLSNDGFFAVTQVSSDGSPAVSSGNLGPARCTTNYPGGGVDFNPSGWPCAVTSGSARAGSFVFSWGPNSSTVVVQLGGCVRCR
jgi:prepilin-type N-terminal cleavage/methylation domain-containing protein